MAAYNLRNKKDPVTYDDLINLFDEKLKDIATKKCIDDLKSIIEDQKKTIVKQQNEIECLKKEVRNLGNAQESLEQYGRRSNIRIVGVPPKDNETADECLAAVKKIIEDLDINIPDCCIDRAHRIGKVFTRIDGSTGQTILVKFTTWRHRTMIYKLRKNRYFKNKGIKIYLDLTKKRNELLTNAKEKANGIEHVDFVFADLNCQLGVKFKDSNKLSFFNDLDDLDMILDHE